MRAEIAYVEIDLRDSANTSVCAKIWPELPTDKTNPIVVSTRYPNRGSSFLRLMLDMRKK